VTKNVNIFAFGPVDADLAERVLWGLEDAAADKRPAKVWICSHGGDVGAALALHDALLRHHVTAIATGSCMSAGLIAFLGGWVRVATPGTIFFNHEVESLVEGQDIPVDVDAGVPVLARLRELPQGIFGVEVALREKLIGAVLE
jgi:ATP-dependent protease ClpP protease subunit